MTNSPSPADAARTAITTTTRSHALQPSPPFGPVERTGLRIRLRRLILPIVLLALIWSMLTDWRLDAWVFGLPALAIAAGLLLAMPPSRRWRLSPVPTLFFALWFAVQAVRGAVDVALRAMSPRMPLRPGFRSWRTFLPEGAPRIVLANAVTLLPGTLSAEIEGERLVIHVLDNRLDHDRALADLESRIAAIFTAHLPEGEVAA
ncbi:Na+/H+ antiporter subunit E [Paracoccus bogoriensis]|nr:Na+/H+ antiporter subunit E [Paracoccus bogoriensis]